MGDDVLYHRVTPTIWQQPWTMDAKVLAVFLLTCQHRNTEGLFRLPKLYVQADLGWDSDRLDAAWRQLVDDDFIDYDPDASVLLIVKALKYQSPANPNMVIGACKQVALVPKSSVDGRFHRQAQQHCPRFAEGLTERFPERFPERTGSTGGETSSSNSTSSSTPSCDAEAPREDERDVALAVAVLDACGMDPPAPDTSAAGATAKALTDLDRHGATPDQVAVRAARWADRYPDATLTPLALAKHWPQLGRDRPPPSRADPERHRAIHRASGLAAAGDRDGAAAELAAVGLDLDALDAA